MIKNRGRTTFVAGVIIGTAATSFFCQFSNRSASTHIVSKKRGISYEPKAVVDPVATQSPLSIGTPLQKNEVKEQELEATSPSIETPSPVHILDRYRDMWTNMKLSDVYPPVSDAQPSIRADPFPPDVCLTTGTPISRNWTLLSETDGWTVPRSAQLVLKPEPSTTPYRGHVKVCMNWDSVYWWPEYWTQFGTCDGDKHCDIPCGNIHCRYSWKNEYWNDCSAAIMHHRLDNFVGNDQYVRRVFTMSEPLYKNQHLLNEESRGARDEIDIVAQWHRSANVFLAAHNNQFTRGGENDFVKDMNFGHLRCPPKPDVASKTCVERRMGLTVFNHGNCRTADGFREKFVGELQKYIRVDAYGDCLHNKERPHVQEWAYQQEMELRSHYKFMLAFENEISEDWVTERVYHGLAAGAVPIYYGAPNVYEFLPCTECIIDVTKFAGAEEVAKYMIFLDQNPDKYMEYHAWRDRPMRVPPFMESSKSYFYCGVCKAVADDIEGKLTHVKWDAPGRQWVPDPSRKARPAPPTWTKGFNA